jgi:hypothetical protein
VQTTLAPGRFFTTKKSDFGKIVLDFSVRMSIMIPAPDVED